MKLLGKKAIVTGANRSMGQAIAIELARLGADVVISYRSGEAGAKQTIEEIKALGRQTAAFYADFSLSKNVKQFVDSALDFLGQVDILINNAGMLNRDEIFDLDPETMSRVFQVNTVAPFYLLQLCAESMIEKKITGSIVNISSIAASMTAPRGCAYSASKAALNKLTQNNAYELAKHHIRVNAISPGAIQAGMNEDTAEKNPQLWQEYLDCIPLQRAGTPDDVCRAALFFATDDSNWITGKILEVDGGAVL